MKVVVLASGSRGNAVLVRSGKSAIMFDLGISPRKLKFRLQELREDISDLKAIFVSHEHTDHVYGLEHFCRKLLVPVLATQGTLDAFQMPAVPARRAFRAGEDIRIDSLTVQAFRVSHDAAEPVGFVIADGHSRVGLATDLGCSNALVQERLRGADLVILESNHDVEMLKRGPYTWPLKQRILGRSGHLSNADCARLLHKIEKSGLKKVVLAHLSENNNDPELAYAESRDMIDGRIDIELTSQRRPGPVIEL